MDRLSINGLSWTIIYISSYIYIIIISYMSQDIHLSWDIIHMVVMGYILVGYFMGLMGSCIDDILSWGYHGDIMGI
jgi:hypothetical protein